MNIQVEDLIEDLVKSIVTRLYPVNDRRRNNLHIGPYYNSGLVFPAIHILNTMGYKASYYYSYTDHGFYIDVK